MPETLEKGSLVRDTYIIKKTLYSGRLYNFYLAENKSVPGKKFQLTEFLLSKIPSQTKTMKEEEFTTSVELLREISHPLLPTVVEGFYHEQKAYLVLTCFEGITLDHYLEMQVSPFSVKEAIDRIRQIGDALSCLYSRPAPLSFIHIDTPHILISEDGRMFLMGFGLQLFLDHYLSSSEPDAFCAPEIAEGKRFTEHSATYSLGALLYYFITKKKWNSSRRDNPLPRDIAGDIPDELQQTIVKALNRSPEHRLVDLETFLNKIDEVIRPPVPQEQPPAQERKIFDKDIMLLNRRLKVISYTIGALLLLSFGIWLGILALGGKKTAGSKMAYILSRSQKKINCIDLATGTVKSSLPLSGDCLTFTCSADGNKLYICCKEKTVRIIESSSGNVSGVSKLDVTPGNIVLTPDSAKGYITSLDNPLVIEWNPVTCGVLGKIKSEGAQKSIAISPDGSRIFILYGTKDEVSVIDTSKSQVIGTFPGPGGSGELATDNTGKYLAVTSTDGSISFYDTQDFTLLKTVSTEKGALHISSPSGRSQQNLVYIACEEGSSIYEIDYASLTLERKSKTKGTPISLALSGDGNVLYVLSNNPESLLVLDAGSLEQIKLFSTGLSSPNMLRAWP